MIRTIISTLLATPLLVASVQLASGAAPIKAKPVCFPQSKQAHGYFEVKQNLTPEQVKVVNKKRPSEIQILSWSIANTFANCEADGLEINGFKKSQSLPFEYKPQKLRMALIVGDRRFLFESFDFTLKKSLTGPGWDIRQNRKVLR
jgi:hypothetical protein